MIVPSIDLRGGCAVQLVGGEHEALNAGDPRPILESFRLAGDVAVIDLDAALGTGDNSSLIDELCRMGSCRVGGGIRDYETAVGRLDAGAKQIILGTAADALWLADLPRERVMLALDARDGEVVVDGWRRRTGDALLDRIESLRDRCGAFLVTFVEREGRMSGTDLELARQVVQAAQGTPVTIAGGVQDLQELRELDELGADAQVGMALYTQAMNLADAFAAPLHSDREDGLWPTVVCDESGRCLGLAYSSAESLRAAFDQRRGIYQSRKRGLWVKGESSGATQELLAATLDCDRDTLRFTVRQRGGGFCHLPRRTCFGEDWGLPRLARRLTERRTDAPKGSYTRRLFEDRELLNAKLSEEAQELMEAETRAEVTHEAADLLYFTLVRAAAAGVSLEDIENELDRRESIVTRRPGNAKEPLR